MTESPRRIKPTSITRAHFAIFKILAKYKSRFRYFASTHVIRLLRVEQLHSGTLGKIKTPFDFAAVSYTRGYRLRGNSF